MQYQLPPHNKTPTKSRTGRPPEVSECSFTHRCTGRSTWAANARNNCLTTHMLHNVPCTSLQPAPENPTAPTPTPGQLYRMISLCRRGICIMRKLRLECWGDDVDGDGRLSWATRSSLPPPAGRVGRGGKSMCEQAHALSGTHVHSIPLGDSHTQSATELQ